MECCKKMNEARQEYVGTALQKIIDEEIEKRHAGESPKAIERAKKEEQVAVFIEMVEAIRDKTAYAEDILERVRQKTSVNYDFKNN